MNRIRGSIIAKIIAWIVFFTGIAGMLFFGAIMIVGVTEDFFQLPYEEAKEQMLFHINENYSLKAFKEKDYVRNEARMAELGFRYGILENKNQDLGEVDFNDPNSYMQSNFFMEDFNQKISAEDLFYYQIFRYNNGHITGTYVGTYEEYVQDKEAIQEINQSNGWNSTVEWQGLYADRICYDTSGGIFYYHAEGKYYPVQKVYLTYIKDQMVYQYAYLYDFDKKAYKYLYTEFVEELEAEDKVEVEAELEENPQQDETAEEAESETETDVLEDNRIEQILTGEGQEGFVNFQALDDTDFSYTAWGEILLDDIRYLQAEELNRIDSKSISAQQFSDATAYYLNENYTLMVAQPTERSVYWVVSLIPQNIPEGQFFVENGYAQGSLLLDIVYYFGEGAIGGFVSSGILAFAAFVFLMVAAGHRKNREEIVLLPFPDKVPLDIWTAAVFFAEVGLALCLHLIIRVNIDNLLLILSMIIIVLFVGTCIALWYLLGFCVRVKKGKWWRNTFCYMVLGWINAHIRNGYVLLSQNIGILWKIIGLYGILTIVELILLLAIWSRNDVVLLWFIEKAIVFVLLAKLVLQMRDLQEGSRHLAEGDLQYHINTDKMFWECRKHGENLNKIGVGMSKAVDERMKSERLKTELITNVSHDIKTPLTSIINYVDLLQKEDLQNEKAVEYLEVLERQSSKLKKLIEDLVEASKASSGNISVVHEKLDVGVFLVQTVGEFEEKLLAANLELIMNKPEETLYILADGRHLWRVVDNLMNNICKYAQPHSRVYVNLGTRLEYVEITFRNMSKYPLNINSDELTERFVRGDRSRNTEGHGLGLSIAKSLVDLMGGEMRIVIDGDLFKVILSFQKKAYIQLEKEV